MVLLLLRSRSVVTALLTAVAAVLLRVAARGLAVRVAAVLRLVKAH
jgi:hypothetical protein